MSYESETDRNVVKIFYQSLSLGYLYHCQAIMDAKQDAQSGGVEDYMASGDYSSE